MPRFVWMIVGLTSLAAGAACTQPVNVEQERTALMAADREWSQTTKDVDRFVSYFAEDASIYAPGMPIVTGGDAIRKAMAEMINTPGFALTWTPAKADVAASGDLGYTTGAYEMKMAGGSEKGKYVTTWRKDTGGAWKVTEDIFNADAAPNAPASTHAMLPAAGLTWGDMPPGLPAGAKAAVVFGNPAEPQPYVIRAQMPANYRIPAHWHPTTENVTVLSGTVAIGMGDTWDEKTMQDLPVGGFASLPGEMRHTFMTKTAATIQVHGMGPFGITYVNAADDPRTKKGN